MEIEEIDEVEFNGLSKSLFPTPDETPLTEEEKNYYNRIKKAADAIIPDLHGGNLKPINATPAEETETLLKTKEVSSPIRTRNVGFEMIKLGKQVERFRNAQINGYIQKASEIQERIAQLIDLNGKLVISGESEDAVAISDEIRAVCADLKEKGIDILQGNEKTLPRERIAELKAHISAHTDRLKTELQTIFSTKIQVGIQEVQSILECMKTTEKYINRSQSNMIANQKAGR